MLKLNLYMYIEFVSAFSFLVPNELLSKFCNNENFKCFTVLCHPRRINYNNILLK